MSATAHASNKVSVAGDKPAVKVDREAAVLDPAETANEEDDDIERQVFLATSLREIEQRHGLGKLGRVDVHENAGPPCDVVALTRRVGEASPCRSVGWQRAHRIRLREMHDEDERERSEREDDLIWH